jgi:hypothetical protein
MVVPGLHPTDANVLAGAYLPTEEGGMPEAGARSLPVAGSSVSEFELLEDIAYTYEASFEMYLVRTVDTTPGEVDGDGVAGPSETIVDEFVDAVWLFAGDWQNLQPRLAAGTWFSGTPVEVPLSGSPLYDEDNDVSYYEAVEPLILDSLAPAVIGFDRTETEPNDVVVDIGSFALDPTLAVDQAEDIGMLSGDGYIDILRGTIDIGEGDGWIHDSDSFMFTVPVEMTLFISLGWDTDADLDLVVNDGATGDPLDWSAGLANPEVDAQGYTELFPEEIYFLTVLGYSGASANYELCVEEVAL